MYKVFSCLSGPGVEDAGNGVRERACMFFSSGDTDKHCGGAALFQGFSSASGSTQKHLPQLLLHWLPTWSRTSWCPRNRWLRWWHPSTIL